MTAPGLAIAPSGGRTRIAPTPSGFLHAGNAFNFLVTEQLARHWKSNLLLRIDDLDAERVRPEYIEDIFESLEWLGIQCDEGPSGPAELETAWSQRHRIGTTTDLAHRLKDAGHLYACTCSRAEFARMKQAGAVHSCRDREIAPTTACAWRLAIPANCRVPLRELDGSRTVGDLSASMEDPVIVQRGEGRPAYQLASLSDDLGFGVTFVVRGADLLPSTLCQMHLATLLGLAGFASIRFHHHPLLLGLDGSKLSKSEGANSLRAMRQAGISPTALIRHAEEYVEELLR